MNGPTCHQCGDPEAVRALDALRELGVDTPDHAAHEIRRLRALVDAADAFSRSVHRQRPVVWEIAMVDARGPGTYAPP